MVTHPGNHSGDVTRILARSDVAGVLTTYVDVSWKFPDFSETHYSLRQTIEIGGKLYKLVPTTTEENGP